MNYKPVRYRLNPAASLHADAALPLYVFAPQFEQVDADDAPASLEYVPAKQDEQPVEPVWRKQKELRVKKETNYKKFIIAARKEKLLA